MVPAPAHMLQSSLGQHGKPWTPPEPFLVRGTEGGEDVETQPALPDGMAFTPPPALLPFYVISTARIRTRKPKSSMLQDKVYVCSPRYVQNV